MSLEIRVAAELDVDALATLNAIVQDLHAKLLPELFVSDAGRDDLVDAWRGRLGDVSNRIVIATNQGEPIGYL